MGRQPNIIRPTKLTLALPEDVRVRMDLHLFSEVERRIPLGAHSRFISQLIRDYFESLPKEPSNAKS